MLGLSPPVCVWSGGQEDGRRSNRSHGGGETPVTVWAYPPPPRLESPAFLREIEIRTS